MWIELKDLVGILSCTTLAEESLIIHNQDYESTGFGKMFLQQM